MTCGGSMMRTSLNPLAHLVDAAAAEWLAAEGASEDRRERLRHSISKRFALGDQQALSFHGLTYILTLSREPGDGSPDSCSISVHEIAGAETGH